MEFLVRLTAELPHDLAPDVRSTLLEAERQRGLELLEMGALVQIWRLPGQLANVSLYSVSDATELHDLLASLPTWPHVRVEVDALAQHPLTGVHLARQPTQGSDKSSVIRR
jgi:muconolactone D-isomerase